MCNVTRTSDNEAVAWVVNNRLYGINALRSGILTGHTATLGSNNLIVENIMMNDVRNGSEYQCVIVLQDDASAIQRHSNRTVLYVAGEYQYRVHCHIRMHMFIATCCNDLMHRYCICKLNEIFTKTFDSPIEGILQN